MADRATRVQTTFDPFGTNPATTTKQEEIRATINGEYAIRLVEDTINSLVTYIGKAAPGTPTSSSLWQIRRLDESVSPAIVTWADGDAAFDNVFDSRELLTYT